MVADMRLALKSEYGARYLYRMLSRVSLDAELRRVLELLSQEEEAQISALRIMLHDEGVTPRRRSIRRWLGSLATLVVTPVIGVRFALRLSVDAELTVARWYGEYRAFYLEQGEPERALRSQELATTKQRHAQILQTWIAHGRGRSGS